MKTIEVVIRYGDRSKDDSGQVKWSSPQVRVGMVSGQDGPAMKDEARLIVAALLRQLEDK